MESERQCQLWGLGQMEGGQVAAVSGEPEEEGGRPGKAPSKDAEEEPQKGSGQCVKLAGRR